jgi:hypothetical protein
MTSKFEQLIEYVINDEENKARELFHDIVVEKSREIYENLMNEEELDEESDADRDDKAEKAGKKVAKDIEYDEKHDKMDEGMAMGGDASDDLIDDVEMEEEGMSMEDEEIEMDAEEEMVDGSEDHHDDMGGNEELEDRVVDLEDKLDELMAEFEAMMGGEEADAEMEVGDMEGDALEMDDTEEMDEMGNMGMYENVDLKAAPKPVTSEEGGTNTKSTVAANAGARGAVAKPVNPDAGGEEKGRTAPTAKDMGGTTSPKQGPATKPVTAQAAGVNTRTPFPKA